MDEPDEAETYEQRLRRLEGQKVRPESEERKSPCGPGSQVAPGVEPAGS